MDNDDDLEINNYDEESELEEKSTESDPQIKEKQSQDEESDKDVEIEEPVVKNSIKPKEKEKVIKYIDKNDENGTFKNIHFALEGTTIIEVPRVSREVYIRYICATNKLYNQQMSNSLRQ
jgi:hypothetical protein